MGSARETGEGAGRNLTRPVRVMLVEDHAPFRRALSTLVNRQSGLEVVAEAGSLDEARCHAVSIGFDVVLLDLRLPDGNGIDLIAEIRGVNPDAGVVILSATLDPRSLSKAKEAGADKMLDKLATPDEIVTALKRLGNPYVA
jgi:two-component system response regulator DevR